VKDATGVVEWTEVGTANGPGFWGKPNGKAYGFNGASILTFNDDGLVKEEHVYMDGPTMMSQLGMGPKGPAHPIAKLPDGPPEVHMAKGGEGEDASVASAKAFNRVFEKGDEKAFLDGMVEDASYDDISMPAPMTGKKQAKSFYDAFSKAFPNPKITENNIFGIESYSIDEWTMEATQKAALNMGPGMTIPNSKKTITTHTLEIVQWKDGKMAKGWAYDNSFEFLSQLGVIKAPHQAKMPEATKVGDTKTEGKAEGKKAEAPKGDAKKDAKPAK
jgi:hypothetical protein